MTIQLVVIADANNGIGKNNQLLCHLPADLKHFKQLTVGSPVIMGRKTFESIGKPLPGRRNIVITSQDTAFEGCETVHSVNEAFRLCQGEEKISVIGGAAIFTQTMNLANTIYLTRLKHTFEADTFFPPIDPAIWEETYTEPHPADQKNNYPYTFITYKRHLNSPLSPDAIFAGTVEQA